MTREERELAITYLEEMKETYIEGVGYERHPLPEYYAIESAIKALEQEPKTEKVIKMRDATPEERESIEKYVKSISKPTGVDFWDLEQEPCEDAISRAEALRHSFQIYDDDGFGYKVIYADKIKQLPSVKPQEKTGHWIEIAKYSDGNHKIECSECKSHIFDRGHANSFNVKNKYKYCPNCGARMIKPQESEG